MYRIKCLDVTSVFLFIFEESWNYVSSLESLFTMILHIQPYEPILLCKTNDWFLYETKHLAEMGQPSDPNVFFVSRITSKKFT